MAEISQTLDRGLRVLEVLAENPQGLTVTETAAALGVSRTIVYRLVVTLEQHGFLRRSQDGRCRLGMASLSLARQIHPVLRNASIPFLRKLADAVGATAHLTLVEGNEAIAVAVVESSRVDPSSAYHVGTRVPVERGVAGRAAVATRTSGRTLEPGWVISGGDPSQGGYAMAAPVLGVAGFEASVGVLSPVELDAAVVGPRVVTAAGEISRALR